jgi:putative SOS response-associated peptidase YedK
MCAQFDLRLSAAELLALLGLFVDSPALGPPGRRFPGQRIPLLRAPGHPARAVEALWGIAARPPGPDGRPAAPAHNARAETVTSRPAFRAAWCAPPTDVTCGRGVVPASAIVEWDPRGAASVPVRLSLPDDAPLLLAAVWVDGGAGPAAAILTRAAGPVISAFHDREPVVLEATDLEGWWAGGAAADALRGGARSPDWVAARGAAPRQQSLFGPRG